MSMLEPTVVLLGDYNQYAAKTPVKHPIRAHARDVLRSHPRSWIHRRVTPAGTRSLQHL